MFVVWFVSFAALTGRGDWNDLMNFVHAAPLMPRARDLKVAVPSFEVRGTTGNGAVVAGNTSGA